MKIYTYVLKDRERNLYKIGQSTNPKARFRQLCIPGKLFPIHIFDEDIEKELHRKFKEERLAEHPVFYDGRTEYFKYGGKMVDFVDNLDIEEIPFYTPHNLYLFLEDKKHLWFDSVMTKNIALAEDYSEWNIGRKILVLLGYLYYDGFGYKSIHEGVELDGAKTYISDAIMEDILEEFRVDIVSNRFEAVTEALKKKFAMKIYTRKIGETPIGTPIYLIVTQIKK
jgi:hypothetical protein